MRRCVPRATSAFPDRISWWAMPMDISAGPSPAACRSTAMHRRWSRNSPPTPCVGFEGWLAPDAAPRVLDPAEGLLWSANARVVGGEDARLIGDDGMDRGARAAQIHADLQAAAQPLVPLASLRVQLDDRARFLERWRVLLGEVIERARARGDHSADTARDVLARWSGHAAADDAAYRLDRVVSPRGRGTGFLHAGRAGAPQGARLRVRDPALVRRTAMACARRLGRCICSRPPMPTGIRSFSRR